MATTSIKNKYIGLIKDLFPQGWAWNIRDLSLIDKLLGAISTEFCRVEERAIKFSDELDPKTTFEMIDNWERLLGIPDECTPADADPSLFERRVRICQKLVTGGGQSPAFFKEIASQLGYDADIIDVQNFKDFRVGEARVGDRLSNGSTPGTGWGYTFAIVAPAELTRAFRVGQSTVGERLQIAENDTLECVIQKFKPAHVNVLFSFGS